MKNNSYLRVDTRALAENVEYLRSRLGEARLVPVIKGDAYGLGAAPMAARLTALGLDTFAVSHVSEGISLRSAGIEGELWLLSIPPDFLVRDAAEAGMVITLGSFHQLEGLKAVSQSLGRPVDIQLKLDTGLRRIGFLPEELPALASALREGAAHFRIVGTFSHFADSEIEHMDVQYAAFLAMTERLRSLGVEPGLRHMASSAQLEESDKYILDAVRIGRGLYMDNPDHPTGRIREVASFRAFIEDIRPRRAGEAIAYGGSLRLERDSLVAVVSVGYGDGLDMRLAEAHAPVLVGGKRARLLAACMDQCFVDVTDIDCAPGDEVTFFGYDREGNFLSSQAVAALAGANEGCGLTSALLPRVARVYE